MKLPELGENIEGGDVLRVMVKPGDAIKKDQPVLELETDKATIEVPSSADGVVKEIKIKAGEKVKVGQTIFVVEEGQAQGKGRGQRAKSRRAKSRSAGSRAPKRQRPRRSRRRRLRRRRKAQGRSRRDEAAPSSVAAPGRVEPTRPKPRRGGSLRPFPRRLPRAGWRASWASTFRTFKAPVPAAASRWTM